MIKSFIFLNLHAYIISFIIMPFYTYKTNISYNITDYYTIQAFTENNIYTYLLIGTPPQKIIANINFNDYVFNIYNNQCDIPSDYNSLDKNSTTSKNKGYILADVYVDTFLYEDIFSLPHGPNKYYKLNYIYAPLNNNLFEQNIEKKKFTCANIGLKLSMDFAGTFDFNFLRELKNLDVIDNYVFYLYYNDTIKEEGNLIIGNWPHEIDKNKFDINDLKEEYAINNKKILCWKLKFDTLDIQCNDNKDKVFYNLTNNLEAEIDYNLNVIYANHEFMELIDQLYFKKQIDNKICTKIYINNNNLIYYECDISLDITTFPNIIFIHKIFSSKFILSYKDVFISDNIKYIFLVWFDLSDNKIWKLGKPFLKKYLFTFDLDKKTIGYYSNKVDSKKFKDDKNVIQNKNIILLKVICLILLSFIAFILCYFCTKYYYQQKKQSIKNIKLTELIYVKEEKQNKL